MSSYPPAAAASSQALLRRPFQIWWSTNLLAACHLQFSLDFFLLSANANHGPAKVTRSFLDQLVGRSRPWLDTYSQGPARRSLIAFIAFFVPLCASAVWRIATYILHHALSSRAPAAENGLCH